MKKNIEINNNNYVYLKFLVLSWLFVFIILGVAFSGFTSGLKTEGIALIQSHIYDYVYITHASVSDNSGASSINYSFLDHEIKANISAPSCNNYVTYKLDILNTTVYKAYITSAGLASAVNGSGNSTSSFSVEFIDGETNNPIVVNSTYIPAHTTKTIYVKIKNNCTGNDVSGIITANFEYSLYKYFDLTIKPTPSDAKVSITTGEGTYTGTGSLTHRVHEGDIASYEVSKKYYYTKTSTYTMGTEDHTINVTLDPDPHRDLTINATPNSSTIVISQNGTVLASGSGSVTASVVSGESVTYTVSDPEYYYTVSDGVYSDYSNTETMPTTEVTKNITLNERPWITGTLSNTINTEASTKSGINWHSGYYLVEVWGGKGGTGDKTVGASGYVYGVVYIPYNYYVIESAGGNGSSGTSEPSGGANGGGIGGKSGTSSGGNKGGGGGYSSVIISSLNNDAINSDTISSGEVKFIAGGGGGASSKSGTFGTSDGGNGGAGGNMNSTISSITAGSVFSGANGTSGGDNNNTPGKGGSTVAGGKGTSASDGEFLKGGKGYERGGGGGAGYYGGGGGGISSIFASNAGGGGGGSSFVATGVTYSGLSSNITSKLVGTNPSSTGGAVIVTFIGKSL